MHHKALVLGDLHCKALPVERILVDNGVASRGRGGPVGWEGSKGKKGSLALDRLRVPRAGRPSYTCTTCAARLPTFSRQPLGRRLIPSLTRSLVPRSSPPVTGRASRPSADQRSHASTQEAGNFSVYISCRRVVWVSVRCLRRSRACIAHTRQRSSPHERNSRYTEVCKTSNFAR